MELAVAVSSFVDFSKGDEVVAFVSNVLVRLLLVRPSYCYPSAPAGEYGLVIVPEAGNVYPDALRVHRLFAVSEIAYCMDTDTNVLIDTRVQSRLGYNYQSSFSSVPFPITSRNWPGFTIEVGAFAGRTYESLPLARLACAMDVAFGMGRGSPYRGRVNVTGVKASASIRRTDSKIHVMNF